MRSLLFAALVAGLTLPAVAADLPTFKPDIHEQVLPYQLAPAQQPYCHSLFPAWFIVSWSCDPFHLGDGTTDRSVSHPPGVRPSPPSPPGPPDDGCGDHGDKGHGDHHGHDVKGDHSSHEHGHDSHETRGR